MPKNKGKALKIAPKTPSKKKAAIAPATDGPEHQSGADFPIVGIGASAGGLEAFTKLLHKLPVNTGLALVLIQHLDPKHESILASLLSRATRMPVHEIKHKMQVRPNHVYVIPPNANMRLVDSTLVLSRRRNTPEQYMPVDYFFQSLAAVQKNKAIGVILSGTASDGTVGLRAIKSEGGVTFAQEQTTARFDGMPRSAISAGVVDFVLSPEEIAAELARISEHPYVASDGSAGGAGQARDLSGTISKRYSGCCARILAPISLYTREPPSSGDCGGAWYCRRLKCFPITSSSCRQTRRK